MAVRFSEDQVLKATGAHKVQSSAVASYTSVSTDTRSGCTSWAWSTA